ncbi:hypothetical protein TRVA0_068S00386 [Trichomonascus vanleenenianus]|uniref:uncharacterized protein n=1 Tax=Trichomonascus vanleenenianus TaxID=2268995 RepID=UPI003EC9641C
MVSKRSAVSLALAFASALGQTCTVSNSASTLVNDFSTLASDCSTFASAINAYEGSPDDAGVEPIYNDLSALIPAMQTVDGGLTFASGSSSECDISAIISAFTDAAPDIINALTAIADHAGEYINTDGGMPLLSNFGTLAPYVTEMLTSLYGLAPCDIVGQTSSLAGQIADALAACAQNFPTSISAAPAQPTGCAPTSPPTCKKVSRGPGNQR